MVMAETMNKNQQYLDKDKSFVNPVLDRYFHIVTERAAGSYLYDMNGDAYLDFSTGIAVNNVGHCHPKVVEAVQKQVATLMHTSVVTHHKPYIDLCEKLSTITPKGLESIFLSNSGAEAVEGAIKMARYVTGRPGIINFKGAFHGRTFMATALTNSKLYYRERYEPLPGPVYTLPYPYVFRSNTPNDPEACVAEVLEHFNVLFNQFISPEQVASIIVEPVLGEGGYVVPPSSFLPKLKEIANRHGILLIADEVQSGFGRTGKLFAVEHSQTVPDIMLMAKAIGGGMPISAFATRREISEQWKPARHGSTYGGNPVSCAAALATIGVIQEEKLVDRSATLGKKIIDRLTTFAKSHPHVSDVRGLGLMIGVEFSDKNGKPSKEIAHAVADKCFENKLLVLTCGSYGQVIRLIPPLNMSDDEANKGIDILEKAIASVKA